MSGRSRDPPNMKSNTFRVNDLPVLEAPYRIFRPREKSNFTGSTFEPVNVSPPRINRASVIKTSLVDHFPLETQPPNVRCVQQSARQLSLLIYPQDNQQAILH